MCYSSMRWLHPSTYKISRSKTLGVTSMIRLSRSWLPAATLLLAVGTVEITGLETRAQVQVPPQAPPVAESNPLRTVDGATLFQAHCAVCHGKDATGGGPAAA